MALEPLIYDETTGLPKLPEGFAWRVEENDFAYRSDDPESVALSVRIAKRCESHQTWWEKFIGQEPHVYWEIYHHELEIPVEQCANDVEALKSVTTKAYNDLRDRQLVSESLKSLVGYYPPKSIR